MPTITVPAALDSLATIREYIERESPTDFRDQTSSVLLVAEELLVNVFSYAYPVGYAGSAEVDLATIQDDGEEKLLFTVKDWGAPFNPFEEAPVPDLTLNVDSRPIGGLGVFLIQQVSEKQTYQYVNDTNCIHIVFKKKASA